jgi:HAMP domain-containing protein
VTRVAREVGTEGKLGGQAEVKGVAGTWKDLTDNVNFMAANLTTQVRGIAKVVTDVANGNLKRKLVLETKGEIAELADTINGMIDTLAVFGDQVTTVAREVGIEGKLGGQASVPGAAGTWRDLTTAVQTLSFYPRTFSAPNGDAFVAGPDPLSQYLDTSGTGQWIPVANRVVPSRDFGSAVMYAPGKILYVGGGEPATASAEVIDLNHAVAPLHRGHVAFA